MLGTPNNLEILIHYFVSAAPHPRLHAPAVQEGLDYLQDSGLIDGTDCVTEKGGALLYHILNLPFPVQRWEIPSGTTKEQG